MNQSSNPLPQLVAEETQTLQKATKRAYLISVVLMVILFGYLGFIYASFKQMLDPEDLAIIIVTEGTSLAEQTIDTYQAEAVEAAPRLANTLNRRVTEEFIPSVGALARQQIDQTHEQWIPYLGEEFTSYFTTYFATNEESLRQLAEMEEERMAEAFIAEMMAEWTLQWDATLREMHPEDKGVAYFQEGLDITLGAMDITLTELLETEIEELGHRERLQRRILAQLVDRFVRLD